MNYDWDWSILLEPAYLRVLLRGLQVTVELTAISVFLGTPAGVFLGLMACIGGRTSPTHQELAAATTLKMRAWRLALACCRWLARGVIDIIRAVPLLVLILAMYYALPILADSIRDGLRVTAFQAAAIAMCLNLAGFAADLVRGATAGVPAGSVLAARSLGMPTAMIWRRVILPHVARETLPSMTMLYITMFKMSTLASAIAVHELLHSAEAIINIRYKPLELYFAVCLLFVIVIVPLSIGARWLENTKYFARRS